MVRLGEVATIERQGVAPEKIQSGTTYVGLEHIQSGGSFVGVGTVAAGELASSKFSFTPAHLLYGKLRPYLTKIALPEFEGVCSTDILPVRPGAMLDRRYLAHFLRQPHQVSIANTLATGVNLPRLSPNSLSDIRIPFPPLDEQRRIAAILDKADDLRAKRRDALAHLDTLTRSIFHDMFGSTPSSRVELSTMIRARDRINYGVVQPGDDSSEGVPLIRVADVVRGSIDTQKLKKIDTSIESKYKRSRVVGDEILVSCVGTIGKTLLVERGLVGCNIARAVSRIPLNGEVNRVYVKAVLDSEPVQNYFSSELRTVSQPTLNIK